MSRDTRRPPVPERVMCHCDGFGWVHTEVRGPDGVLRDEVRPCKACNPTGAHRHDDGYRRDDPAIERHRRHRDRHRPGGHDR